MGRWHTTAASTFLMVLVASACRVHCGWTGSNAAPARYSWPVRPPRVVEVQIVGELLRMGSSGRGNT